MTTTMPLATLMVEFRPGSRDDAWTWDDEITHMRYSAEHADRTRQVMQSILDEGQWDPVQLGSDGRVWDGHHRIAALFTLGIDTVLVEGP